MQTLLENLSKNFLYATYCAAVDGEVWRYLNESSISFDRVFTKCFPALQRHLS